MILRSARILAGDFFCFLQSGRKIRKNYRVKAVTCANNGEIPTKVRVFAVFL